jgi:hypothetical protein
MLIVSAQPQIGSGNTPSAAYGSMAVNIKRKPCGVITRSLVDGIHTTCFTD